MRVIECNLCGQVVSAANDEELVRGLRRHHEAEHRDAPVDEDTARELVAADAYDAMDS